MTKATKTPASFKALSWNENPSGGDMALKHTYATMDISFDGDEINGKGLSSFILTYHPGEKNDKTNTQASTSYDGHVIFEGTILGRKGAVAFREHGTTSNGLVDGKWTIIPETATGELKGIKGKDGYTFGMGKDKEADGSLEIEFD